MGLSDERVNSNWYWRLSGTVSIDTSYFKWKSGEPGNVAGEDCVAMNGDSKTKTWSAEQCGLQLPFVCETGGQNNQHMCIFHELFEFH